MWFLTVELKSKRKRSLNFSNSIIIIYVTNVLLYIFITKKKFWGTFFKSKLLRHKTLTLVAWSLGRLWKLLLLFKGNIVFLMTLSMSSGLWYCRWCCLQVVCMAMMIRVKFSVLIITLYNGETRQFTLRPFGFICWFCVCVWLSYCFSFTLTICINCSTLYYSIMNWNDFKLTFVQSIGITYGIEMTLYLQFSVGGVLITLTI